MMFLHAFSLKVTYDSKLQFIVFHFVPVLKSISCWYFPSHPQTHFLKAILTLRPHPHGNVFLAK